MIPKPRSGEGESKYIGRCMGNGHMKRTYPKKDQRLAVCYSTWRKGGLKDDENLPPELEGILPKKAELKLETKRLDNVEILHVGTWNKRVYGEKEMDEAIAHFKEGLIEPYINIAHDNSLTDQMKKVLGVFSFGWVDNLWRDGKKLLANFKQVPKMVAEWIESGALKQRSVEWWHRFTKQDGTKVRNVLEAVTFFGANGIPAVPNLSDVMDLYQSALSSKTPGKGDGEKGVIFLEEDSGMAEVKIDSAELEKLKASAKKTEDLEKKLGTFAEKADKEKKAELAKAAKEKDDKIEKLEKDAKERDEKDAEKHKETLKAEGKAYIDKIVLEKKLSPEYQDDEIDRYVELKLAIESAEEKDKKSAEEKFARFKKKHENAGEVLKFDSLQDPGKKEDELDRSMLQDENKLEEAIQGRKKAKGITWDKAREEILAELGEEV